MSEVSPSPAPLQNAPQGVTPSRVPMSEPSPLPSAGASTSPGAPVAQVSPGVSDSAGASTGGDEALDLGTLDAGASPAAGAQPGVQAASASLDPSFTPYVFDRSGVWVLLPAFALVLVGVHLRRLRPAGHRSEVRPQPGAEVSPLSQFRQKRPMPPGGGEAGSS